MISRIQEVKNIVRQLAEVPVKHRMESRRTVRECHRTVWFELGIGNNHLHILAVEWITYTAEYVPDGGCYFFCTFFVPVHAVIPCSSCCMSPVCTLGPHQVPFLHTDFMPINFPGEAEPNDSHCIVSIPLLLPFSCRRRAPMTSQS